MIIMQSIQLLLHTYTTQVHIDVQTIKYTRTPILEDTHRRLPGPQTICFSYNEFTIHPRGNKMYHDLNVTYWWYEMKRDVAEYVTLLRYLLES
jgi:hypothetical protein